MLSLPRTPHHGLYISSELKKKKVRQKPALLQSSGEEAPTVANPLHQATLSHWALCALTCFLSDILF